MAARFGMRSNLQSHVRFQGFWAGGKAFLTLPSLKIILGTPPEFLCWLHDESRCSRARVHSIVHSHIWVNYLTSVTCEMVMPLSLEYYFVLQSGRAGLRAVAKQVCSPYFSWFYFHLRTSCNCKVDMAEWFKWIYMCVLILNPNVHRKCTHFGPWLVTG